MKITDILSMNVKTLYENQTLHDAFELFLKDDQLIAIPVINQKKEPVNLVHPSDLLGAILKNVDKNIPIFSLEKHSFTITSEYTTVEEALNTSQLHGVVVDSNGQIKTVYSLQNLALSYFLHKRQEFRAMEAFFEYSYDGIYITDAVDGKAKTLKINKSYERITGLNRNHLLDRYMNELIEEGYMSESSSLLVLKHNNTITLSQTFKSGRKGLITSTPVRNEHGEIVMIVTNVRDITELSELKDKLEQNQELTEKYISEIEVLKSQFLETPGLKAEDPKTLEILRLAKKVSEINSTVLLLGESGVGKEEFAKFIHKNSPRQSKPFIKVNCGAIPHNLMESELFGYEKGAFTGASSKGKKGLFEVANEGTLFLDEIAELPLDLQVKLLRVLQENEITHVGGTEPIKIDIRIISATNKDLQALMEKNLFREDLFYRLNVIPISIPPLRERKDDIYPLLNHFLSIINDKYKWTKSFTTEALNALYLYDWPGNVRELSNIVERSAVMSSSNHITCGDLPPVIGQSKSNATYPFEKILMPLDEAVGMVEKNLITEAYKKFGNVRDAAKALGIASSTFVRKRQKYSE